MADRFSGVAQGELAEALDDCLERLRAGEAVDACLAAHAHLAQSLRPLLTLAQQLLDQVVQIDERRLERARARFFQAASEAREQAARQADALDAAVERLRLGEPAEKLLAEAGLGAELGPLVTFAERLLRDVAVPPPPTHGLESARERLLAAARRSPDRAVRERALGTGWLASLRRWLAPPPLVALPRLAAVAAAGLILLLAANVLLAPRVAAAIPGDTFYGWKLLGENVRLAFTFDPAARERLEGQISQERARELEAAAQMGRSEEISWRVRLVAQEMDAQAGGGRLVITPLGLPPEEAQEWVVVWNESTRWLVGTTSSVNAVPLPVGCELELRLRIRGPDEPPLVVQVRYRPMGGLAQGTPTSIAQTPTATVEEPSATPQPISPTPTAEPATATALPSPSPSPWSTASPSATTVLVAPADHERDEPRRLLRGTVRSKMDDAWEIADDGQSGRLVTADVSRLSAADRERVRPGDWVRLVGKWRGHRTFIAEDLDDYRPWESRCTRHEAVGDVMEFTPGSWLKLSTGQGFRLSGAGAVDALVAVGAQVRVVWLDCGSGDVRVLQVVVLRSATPDQVTGTPEPRGPYQGVVEAVLSDTSFQLAADDGSRYTVFYDAQTPIVGVAQVIRAGQEVGVYGWLSGSELRAQRIEVYRDAPPATPSAAGTEAAGVATMVLPTPATIPPPSTNRD